MKRSLRASQWTSGVALLALAAAVAIAEPDKGPPPKCGGKDCSAALPPGPPGSVLKQETKASNTATSKVNTKTSAVKQATGGDDGGGDGGLKSKAALSKTPLGKTKLAPPPPGNVSKAVPKTEIPKAQSPRDPGAR